MSWAHRPIFWEMAREVERADSIPSADDLAELRRLSELKPEPVETVTSTGAALSEMAVVLGLPHAAGTCQECDGYRACTLLARYSETLDAASAAVIAEPFDASESERLEKLLGAVLDEIADEGDRIRKTRGPGR